MWASDAQRMVKLGLTYVRIGEFAWSRIEPEPGVFDWGWLDRAVETLGNAGLKIILGTPTATPPKWLIDKYPDILPCDAYGLPRTFGSRRHYSFSSKTYQRESARIVEAMAKRYGVHPNIVMWQTDNEYGCHDTVESNDPDARAAFQDWLAKRYRSVDVLNKAWGCVFWSQEYRSFDEVDPPLATVTEPNPSHVLDWRRFSSDQVAAYNAMQIELIQKHAPGRDITHNFMGHFTEFDHYPVGDQIDISTWDSYPLGFLEEAWWDRETKIKYARTGHPDFAAFHHDLYRGMSSQRWGVMEQQPGPVNWARFNPAPLDGMVKLWTLEAAAHGAEFVSYFRWRQAPFAQEQMHAGLNRPDNKPDQASIEATEALKVLDVIGDIAFEQSDAALVFDYEAMWLFETHPQGRSFKYDQLVFQFYSAMRRLGLNVDIIGPGASLDGYKLIAVPSLPIISDELANKFEAAAAQLVFGPRSGSKTETLQIPAQLAPGPLKPLLNLTVERVESLGPGVRHSGQTSLGDAFVVQNWMEHVSGMAEPADPYDGGRRATYQSKSATYLSVWPDENLLKSVVSNAAERAGLGLLNLPEGLRVRCNRDLSFAFNYGEAVDLIDIGAASKMSQFLCGDWKLGNGKVAIWRG